MENLYELYNQMAVFNMERTCIFVLLCFIFWANPSNQYAIEPPKSIFTNPDTRFFEGDTIYSPYLRNGIYFRYARWPSAVVPYVYDSGYTKKEIEFMEEAITDYKQTCARFIHKQPHHKDYVIISKRSPGCFSHVGRIGGPQVVNLASECLYTTGPTIHELMHALGFFHEQNRSDRDKYIKILYKNVQPNAIRNFAIYASNTFGQPYDYNSVMHYDRKAFSRNGEDTIQPLDSEAIIRYPVRLSPIDIAKISRMYNCNNK